MLKKYTVVYTTTTNNVVQCNMPGYSLADAILQVQGSIQGEVIMACETSRMMTKPVIHLYNTNIKTNE